MLAIVRKDLSTVVRNRGVRLPLLITPLVILGVLPTILVLGAEMLVTDTAVPISSLAETARTLDEGAGPTAVGEDADPMARWAVFSLEVLLAPLYLLVPLIVATVIAADSFAGERERGTLEALLHTPASDRQLLAAKFLAAWLPAMGVSLAGFVAYSALANLLAWPSVGRVFFPTGAWLVLALWMSPGLAALGLGVMVVASSRVQSLQAAHQIGSLLVLPVIVLLVGQISGLLLLDLGSVVALGAVIWLAALGLLLTGARMVRRERLALRL